MVVSHKLSIILPSMTRPCRLCAPRNRPSHQQPQLDTTLSKIQAQKLFQSGQCNKKSRKISETHLIYHFIYIMDVINVMMYCF